VQEGRLVVSGVGKVGFEGARRGCGYLLITCIIGRCGFEVEIYEDCFILVIFDETKVLGMAETILLCLLNFSLHII
jgi:hypothetical protein